MTLAAGLHRGLDCRSMIVTPALDRERFLRAQDCGADISLMDLEDSVPPELKDHARGCYLSLRPEQLRGVLGLRVNSPRTAEGLRDMVAVLDARAEPDVIVLPKVESGEEVVIIDEALTSAGKSARLWAIIEGAAGVDNAESIADSCGRLIALSFGAADLSAQIGVPLAWDPLVYARSRVVFAARGRGIEAIDAPTFNLDDPDELAQDARRSAALGFTGKVAIHPRQVPAINAAYSPTPDEVAWARRVEATYSDHGAGIFTVDGAMIGPPFVRKARSILARSGRDQ